MFTVSRNKYYIAIAADSLLELHYFHSSNNSFTRIFLFRISCIFQQSQLDRSLCMFHIQTNQRVLIIHILQICSVFVYTSSIVSCVVSIRIRYTVFGITVCTVQIIHFVGCIEIDGHTCRVQCSVTVIDKRSCYRN